MNDSLEKSIESLNIFGNHAKNLVLLADYIVKEAIKNVRQKKKKYFRKNKLS